MKYYCNPLNVNYRYQFNLEPDRQIPSVSREAADPTLLYYQGKYYIFASMTLGVWVSEDLVTWENHRLPDNLPLYDYAPDARVLGDYVYFCASRASQNCDFYRTKDVLNGPYEKIPGSFAFWDPNLFADEDGKVYFYWGCSNETPIWGTELDPETMQPVGEKKVLITGDPYTRGYERFGENHCKMPCSEEEIEVRYQEFLKQVHASGKQISAEMVPVIKGIFSDKPYIEGAWMDKHHGKYYLQYACPGAEMNVYADGVYVSDHPLGPFEPAKNNPYSYKPGGFIPGAGHGSTMTDAQHNLWHTSTMRISMNHKFERRVGLWPAGLDSDGELFCNQRYGDWPIAVEEGQMDPWQNPQWYLLSYGKKATASSCQEEKTPDLAVDENVQTWWRAATAEKGEWLQVDLGSWKGVHGVQINFADDQIDVPISGTLSGEQRNRYIEEKDDVTRWFLEGSKDGVHYEMIEDKSQADTDLPHDFIVLEEGKEFRYVKLTVLEVPYHQPACISGLRIFGKGHGEKAQKPEFQAVRTSDLDMMVTIHPQENVVGYNILWGTDPQKLYHSYMIFDTKQNIGALVKGETYYVRVDAFNENGITEGTVQKADKQ